MILNILGTRINDTVSFEPDVCIGKKGLGGVIYNQLPKLSVADAQWIVH